MRIELNIDIIDLQIRRPQECHDGNFSLRYPYLLEAAGTHSLPQKLSQPLEVEQLKGSKNHDIGSELEILLDRFKSQFNLSDKLAHIHSQCTINDSFLSSRCLRVHNQLNLKEDSIAIDQVGTAGIGACLSLLGLTNQNQSPYLLSCADQWLSPFDIEMSDETPFRDFCGFLFAGSMERHSESFINIKDIYTFDDRYGDNNDMSSLFHTFGRWLGTQLIKMDVVPDLIIGDPYGSKLLKLAYKEISSIKIAPPRNFHEGTAALIASIEEGSKYLKKGGQALIWTLSLSGHGYAIIVNYKKRT